MSVWRVRKRLLRGWAWRGVPRTKASPEGESFYRVRAHTFITEVLCYDI